MFISYAYVLVSIVLFKKIYIIYLFICNTDRHYLKLHDQLPVQSCLVQFGPDCSYPVLFSLVLSCLYLFSLVLSCLVLLSPFWSCPFPYSKPNCTGPFPAYQPGASQSGSHLGMCTYCLGQEKKDLCEHYFF